MLYKFSLQLHNTISSLRHAPKINSTKSSTTEYFTEPESPLSNYIEFWRTQKLFHPNLISGNDTIVRI